MTSGEGPREDWKRAKGPNKEQIRAEKRDQRDSHTIRHRVKGQGEDGLK